MTETVRSFYSLGGLNVETYDARTLGFPGEIDFWVARARASGGPVLELASGTGRVSWAIARAGIDVVGVDLGVGMIEQAERKRQYESFEVSRRVRFVHGNMAVFDLGQRFALAIIPARAFQALLTIEQQRRSLGNIQRHLKPGGKLIIDIFDPRLDLLAEENFVPQREIADVKHPVSGHAVSIDVLGRTNDRMRQRLVERWRFRETTPNGVIVREELEGLELRWTYRFEMQHLLELCDFVVEEELSDFFGGPPAYGKEQIWIARRKD